MFGSFQEMSIPLQQAGNHHQNGSGLLQQRSGSLSQGPAPQLPHQQQHPMQRKSSGGPRGGQGYKGPNYDPGHAGQQGSMHPNAGFTPMQAGQKYMGQQPYQYQQGYYPNPQYGMMMPQGNYQQQPYPAPQPPSRNQQQAQGYQRPHSQPGRSAASAQAQPQQSPPSGSAAPSVRRNKAIAIIDPTTHTPLIISPRGQF